MCTTYLVHALFLGTRTLKKSVQDFSKCTKWCMGQRPKKSYKIPANITLLCRRDVETVTLGSVTQTTQDEGHVYHALKVVMHEDYDNRSVPYFDDIAIITLKTNVKFTSSVYHICLPKYNEREIGLGKSAIVAGKCQKYRRHN